MKNKVNCIIFDLDGVITSTDEYHYQAWLETAKKLNIDFNRDINKKFLGVSRSDCVDILLKNYNGKITEDLKLKIATDKNEMYKEFLQKMTPDFVDKDVKDTLKKLKELKYTLAIGSSSKNTPLILEKIGYANFFDSIADGNQIVNSKPDLEVFLLAAKKVDKQPEECLVVGDAEADIQGAKTGNMRSASIGHASKLGLGDYQLENLSDLLKILTYL